MFTVHKVTQNIVLHTDGDRNLSVSEHTRGMQIEVGGLQVAHYRGSLASSELPNSTHAFLRSFRLDTLLIGQYS